MKITENASMVGLVYRTTDYSTFKLLKGNRPIEPSRIEKIKKSILLNGYIGMPVVVNEKMEIIDGQGRVEALKKLGLPIEFTVMEGAGLEECVALNTVRTGWKQADFIKAAADEGNEDCKRLYKLTEEFKRVPIPASAIYNDVRERYSRLTTGGAERNPLNIKCSEADFLRVWDTMQHVKKFVPITKKKSKGARDILCGALAFIYEQTDADMERLFSNYEKFYFTDEFIPFASNFTDALNSLSDVYNHHLRNTISFTAAFVNFKKQNEK